MPSPVLHAATGVALAVLGRPEPKRSSWKLSGLIVAAAVLPDLDFVPGVAVGDPNRFHPSISHSMGFAVVAALVLGLFVRGHRSRAMLWVFVAWVSHALLDALTYDGSPPYGVRLFWPLSEQGVYQPVFRGVRHGVAGGSMSEFFDLVFSRANLETVGVEIICGALIIAVCAAVRRVFVMRREGSGSLGR